MTSQPKLQELIATQMFICACEPSGDLYASLFLEKIKEKNPNIEIYGVGGSELKKVGAHIIYNYQQMMVFGFTIGISSILKNLKIYRRIARALSKIRPQSFIAVAYPGLNLLLCRYAKKIGAKVIYILPPQIWAWGEFRKYFIKRWVDEVISFFPFEYNFYKKLNIKTIYMENPLLGKLAQYKRSYYPQRDRYMKKRIGFMPGSRLSEIKRNLPIMVNVMRRIENAGFYIKSYFIINRDITEFREIREFLNNMLDGFPSSEIKIVSEECYETMRSCDLLIICSGTASLEAAIMSIPQIFFNHPSFFDYYFFKRFLKITDYNLANLYFGKKIVPSFVNRNIAQLEKYIYSSIINY